MNDYLDIFTVLEGGSVEDCYGWHGWTIYWDKHALTGELYNPDGSYHTLATALRRWLRKRRSTRRGGNDRP